MIDVKDIKVGKSFVNVRGTVRKVRGFDRVAQRVEFDVVRSAGRHGRYCAGSRHEVKASSFVMWAEGVAT